MFETSPSKGLNKKEQLFQNQLSVVTKVTIIISLSAFSNTRFLPELGWVLSCDRRLYSCINVLMESNKKELVIHPQLAIKWLVIIVENV